MEEFKIYNPDDKLLLTTFVDDSSYRLREVMGANSLELKFSLPEFIPIVEWSYCDFKTERYFMPRAMDYVKEHSQKFAYTLSLEGSISFFKSTKFKFFDFLTENNVIKPTSSFKLKFPITATPRMVAELLIANLKLKYPQYPWTVGDCIESEPVIMDFNHDFCFDVLPKLAESFKTEWEVDKYTLHIRKVERLDDKGEKISIKLSYGYNNGVLGGIRRMQFDSKRIVNRVYIQGGDRNIDRSTYKNDTLLLPKSKRITYQGIEYTTDDSGSYLERVKPLMGEEDSLDVSKFYPKRIGNVSTVEVIDDKKGFYNIIDKDIPADLDFSKKILAGENMTVIFQTGQLAGKELDVKYIHEKRKFELVPIDENGLIYPQGNIIPAVGDTYAVFHMQMPDKYIHIAENEALNETAKYLWENEQPQYTYRWQLDGIYAKRNWGEIRGYLNIGFFVEFSDSQFLPTPVDVRIVTVKEKVNDPQSPEITISNNVSSRTLGSVINEIPALEQTVDRKGKEVVNYIKRRYKDTQETIGMLENALLNFSEGINPITLNTMLALIGDEKLQYEFVTSKANPQVRPSGIYFDQTNKRLICPVGIIQHMTLGEKKLSSVHELSEYKFWNVKAYQSDVLTDINTAYFLYIKASTTDSTNAVYLLSKESIEMESIIGYYHFLVATLNSENDNYRSYTEWYGYTEISPRRMITNLIQSADGKTYFDLANNKLQIGSSTTTVVSPSGDESPIEVDRGDYNSSKSYFIGDKVWYNGIAYVCIKNAPFATIPTNTNYWKPYGQDIKIGIKNLLLNSNFATNSLSPWVQTTTTSIVSDSRFGYCCKAVASSLNRGIFQLPLRDGSGDYAWSVWLKADAPMKCRILHEGGTGTMVVSLTQEWQLFKGKGVWHGQSGAFCLYSNGEGNNFYIANVKYEKGNQPTDWTLAPEDVENQINGAKDEAEKAKSEANKAQNNVKDLGTYMDGVFKDDVIDQAESKAIETHLKNIDETMAQLEATYNKLYVNPYLVGAAKTNLLNAKVNLFGARDNLKKAITDAIATGKTTQAKKKNVNDKYDLFNDAIRAFNASVQEANKAIQTRLDDLSSEKIGNITIGGRNLLRNSNFKDAKSYWGTNGIDSWQVINDEIFVKVSKIKTSVIGRGIYQSITTPRQAGTNYAISVYLKADTPMKIQIGHEGGTGTITVEITNQWKRYQTKGVWNTTGAVTLYARELGTFYIANVQYEEGNQTTAWSPAPEDVEDSINEAKNQAKALEYLKEALKGSTSIDGGLLLTSMIQLGIIDKDKFIEKAGINGTAKNDNDVVIWAGGTLADAQAGNASTVIRLNGTAQLSSNSEGNRIIIDPTNRSVTLKSNKDETLGTWTFYSRSDSYGSNIVLYGKGVGSNNYFRSSLTPDGINYYEKGDNVHARYAANNMKLESFGSSQKKIFSINVNEGVAPYNKMKWNVQGLPPSKDKLSPGDVYVDSNGFLKVVPYI